MNFVLAGDSFLFGMLRLIMELFVFSCCDINNVVFGKFCVWEVKMKYQSILLDTKGNVGLITINRPESRSFHRKGGGQCFSLKSVNLYS